jgi:hypothetical protein
MGLAAAQDQTPRPWRSIDDPPPSGVAQEQAPPPDYQPNYNGRPDYAQANPAPAPQGNYPPPPPNYQQQPYPAQNNYPQNYPAPAPVNVPSTLTIRRGTYVTARANEWLSSDHNQPGDTFSATLDQPIVVDGIVVAHRGQTVTGRVTEAQKAGRVQGTSRLGVQLTNLSLADGQTVAVQSQMINRNGPTSEGRDLGAIAGTTAVGAAIGAAADWGRGAAIGAGAGAAAGIIGVLLTRGQPTVIYPESSLTFRVDEPVTISTTRAPDAFRPAAAQDYQGAPNYSYSSRPPAPAPQAYPPPAYAGPAYPAPYPYPAYGYPYPYVGGVSVVIGPRYGYYYGPRGYVYYHHH